MTGPEHYVEAERLVDRAAQMSPPGSFSFYAEAQVHATLALAAATLDIAEAARG